MLQEVQRNQWEETSSPIEPETHQTPLPSEEECYGILDIDKGDKHAGGNVRIISGWTPFETKEVEMGTAIDKWPNMMFEYYRQQEATDWEEHQSEPNEFLVRWAGAHWNLTAYNEAKQDRKIAREYLGRAHKTILQTGPDPSNAEAYNMSTRQWVDKQMQEREQRIQTGAQQRINVEGTARVVRPCPNTEAPSATQDKATKYQSKERDEDEDSEKNHKRKDKRK